MRAIVWIPLAVAIAAGGAIGLAKYLDYRETQKRTPGGRRDFVRELGQHWDRDPETSGMYVAIDDDRDDVLVIAFPPRMPKCNLPDLRDILRRGDGVSGSLLGGLNEHAFASIRCADNSETLDAPRWR